MSHSTIYRICLLVVVILTIIGGIFYYVSYVENQTAVTEGTLVKEDVTKTEESELTACKSETEGEGIPWQEIQRQYI